MIEFDCPNCKHHLTVPDGAAGGAQTCPQCNAQVTVPGAAPAASNGVNPAPAAPAAAPMTNNAAPAVAPSQGNPETTRIPCPICGELIAAQAKKCRFCGEALTAAPAPAAAPCPPAISPNVGASAVPATANVAPAATNPATAATPSPENAEGARMPCPICGELIATQAKKCRFCGEILGVSAAAAGNCQRPSPGDGQSIPAPAVAGNCPKTDSDYGVKTSPRKKKGIVDYLSDAWERKYDFDGRATQREYWYVMPIFFVLMIVLGWIVTEMERGPKIFLFVLNLVVFCSMLALSCRRCHDANLSGAVGVSMMLFFQIGGIIAFFACKDPSGVIGMLNLFFIVGIIVIGLLPGTKGENKYGPVP